MLIVLIISMIISSIFIVSTLYFAIKFKRLSNVFVNDQKMGVYKWYGSYNCVADVHVAEIERYKNGFSKIALCKVEVTAAQYKDDRNDAPAKIKRNFITLKKTDDIDWLEQSDKVKRKEQLKAINQLK